MPRNVGQLATRAGRSRAPAMRSCRREMAISAPVLPAETAAAASPVRTLSTAFHIDEPLPRRMAWAGLASMAMTLSEGRISQSPASAARATASPRRVGSPWRRKRTWPPTSLRARATPGTTTDGPWSPPMASIEITNGSANAFRSPLPRIWARSRDDTARRGRCKSPRSRATRASSSRWPGQRREECVGAGQGRAAAHGVGGQRGRVGV